MLDIGDEYLWRPDRLVPLEHWVGHIPFAFWLTKVLRPRRIVELGTHRGNSYCAFCQAVAALTLETQASAVDTWQGDLHMASEQGLLNDLRSHHDRRYGSFSTLMPMTFDEARGYFGEGDIDLLHIDGTHTYEAVRHDFETWRNALSSRAVVLFHDTIVRRDNYGVWRLWEELSAEYPAFEFHHSYGLGVLGVGSDQAPQLRSLFTVGQSNVTAARIRALFAARGEAHISRLAEGQLQARLESIATLLDSERTARSACEASAHERDAAIAALTERCHELEEKVEIRDRTEAAHRAFIDSQQRELRQLAQERDALAHAHTTAIVGRQHELEQLMKERDALAQLHDVAVANHGRELKRLMRELEREAVERSESQAAYSALSAQKATVEAQRLQFETERDELRRNILRIQTSTSWRITKPLRHFLIRHQRVAAMARKSAKLSWWTLSGRLSLRLRQRRLWRNVSDRVERSGLFDRHWYLTRYPEIAEARIDPLLHYLSAGAREGRDPGPRFSTARYLQMHPTVRDSGVNPLLHFLDLQAGGAKPTAITVNEVAHTLANTATEPPPAPEHGPSPSLAISDADASPELLPTLAFPAAAPVADGRWEWQAYERVKKKIEALEDKHRASRRLRPFPMIDLSPEEVRRSIGKLVVPRVQDPVVSIIVPVFNHLKETLECLLSIVSNTESTVSYEIIVADDASTDGMVETLASVRNVRYIRNSNNLGFLRNCNNAAKSASGRYVLFLNNDVQVTEGWLAPLVKAFGDRPNVGAVGSKIVYPDGRLQEAGALINPDCSTHLIGIGDDPFLPRYSFAREVDYCSGACLMLERARFEALEGFDDSLAPAYYEDVDICLRLHQQGLSVWYVPESVVVHHLTRTNGSLGEDYKMWCVTTNRQKIAERWQTQIDAFNRVRMIALYLPQFHPFPENDRWWGKGFTEWTNVTKAVPNYVGHYQPRMPAELGYYDLRVTEVMEQQAELARRYGVEGFCYHYYWFAGKRLLELPIERMLETGRPDFPFCLCWANENWTRRWDGQETDILMAQQHSDDDDLAVIRDLSRYLQHKNYIRVKGMPLLLVYRVDIFPDFSRTANIWREFCRETGIGEIYITCAETFHRSVEPKDPAEDGCDAAMQFPPHGYHLLSPVSAIPPERLRNPDFVGHICSFEEFVAAAATQDLPPYTRFAGVMPGWDNTPRRQNHGTIFDGSTPGAFQAWLEGAIGQMRTHHSAEERIVFINAWNEWAEGAYLEPDRRFGHTYLEAVRNALSHGSISGD